jgi:hypothetical protein
MNQPQGPGSNGAQPSKRSRNRGRGGQNQRNQRNRRQKPTSPVDIWAAPGDLPEVEPIVIPNGVDALVRSLGDGPAIGGSTVLDGYVIAVVERTAAVAAALALSADVLADADE